MTIWYLHSRNLYKPWLDTINNITWHSQDEFARLLEKAQRAVRHWPCLNLTLLDDHEVSCRTRFSFWGCINPVSDDDKWYKCTLRLKIFTVFKLQNAFNVEHKKFLKEVKNTMLFGVVKIHMVCLTIFNQNPIGRNPRTLFCVFLPPSSREIQLHIHAFWIRHHICSQSPIRMQKGWHHVPKSDFWLQT